jgi:hypothetical protein
MFSTTFTASRTNRSLTPTIFAASAWETLGTSAEGCKSVRHFLRLQAFL